MCSGRGSGALSHLCRTPAPRLHPKHEYATEDEPEGVNLVRIDEFTVRLGLTAAEGFHLRREVGDLGLEGREVRHRYLCSAGVSAAGSERAQRRAAGRSQSRRVDGPRRGSWMSPSTRALGHVRAARGPTVAKS